MPNRSTQLSDHDAPLAEVVALLQRRKLLRGLLGAGLIASPVASYAACSVIPSETAGPFPGDGTNGPNALTQSGIVRAEMRSSFGAFGSGVAAGVPLTVRLQLVNADNNCALLPSFALYLWHCDGPGNYSLYGNAATQNYLRAVQVTDQSGVVTFSTIVPGTYSGRWPHMHFEVYASATAAVSGRNALRTSQLALPEEMCRQAYSALPAAYGSSNNNLNNITLARDGIFSDGVSFQMVTVTGNATTGYTATLTVAIAAGSGVGVVAGTHADAGKAVEYYNTTLDHYVVVSDPAEIATIDNGGAGPGWVRTGQHLGIPTSDTTGSLPVYRFYGSVQPGPNSHFYSTSEEEKAQLIALALSTPSTQKRWNYEGVGFRAGAASNGVCPQSLVGPSYAVPVYRLYNNGFPTKDANHRYTTSTATVIEMISKGWALEGVVFCSLSE